MGLIVPFSSHNTMPKTTAIKASNPKEAKTIENTNLILVEAPSLSKTTFFEYLWSHTIDAGKNKTNEAKKKYTKSVFVPDVSLRNTQKVKPLMTKTVVPRT